MGRAGAVAARCSLLFDHLAWPVLQAFLNPVVRGKTWMRKLLPCIPVETSESFHKDERQDGHGAVHMNMCPAVPLTLPACLEQAWLSEGRDAGLLSTPAFRAAPHSSCQASVGSHIPK